MSARGCKCPVGAYDRGNTVHESYCPLAEPEPDFLDEAAGAALGFAFLVDDEPEAH